MKKSLFIILFCSTFAAIYGQGCSDAGFCTAPGFAPLGDTTAPFKVGLKLSLEQTEPGTLLLSPQISAGYRISEKVYSEIRIPIWLISDPDIGTNNAFSDPIISFSFLLLKKDENKLTLNAGTRIGISNADAIGNNDVQLPMDYQNSLGTTDLILGLNYIHTAGFSATFGLQYPIWQYNQNQDVVLNYISPTIADTIKFNYHRQPDILLRIDKSWKLGKFGVRVGLLPIFHLGNDELRSTSVNAVTVIKGSTGLTLNIPLGAWYTYNKWVFGLDVGFPVVTRDARPDGLTRKYVAQPRVVYNFD